jgi:hypothetical protein
MGHLGTPIGQSNRGALVRQHTTASKGGTERPCVGRSSIDTRVQGLGRFDAARFLWEADLGFRHRVAGSRDQGQLQLPRYLPGAGDASIWQRPARQSAGKSPSDHGYDDEPKHPPHLMRMDRRPVVAKSCRVGR